jgi:hypothetical protein
MDEIATVLGSIPASADTVESEALGAANEALSNKVHKKIQELPLLIFNNLL